MAENPEQKPAATEEPASTEPSSEPRVLPVLPLRGTVIFPAMLIPLAVGREKSVRLIDEALVGDKMVALVSQKKAEDEDPDPNELYPVGTSALITKMIKMPDQTVRIMVHGQERIRLGRILQAEPYIKAEIELLEEQTQEGSLETEALIRNVRQLFARIVEQSPQLPDELGIMALNISEPGKLADMVATGVNISLEERQDLLETLDVRQRLEKVQRLLSREIDILELGSKIQSEIKTEIDKGQREFYLRQQLKALQKELGEGDERTVEMEELRKRLDKAKMPKAVREVAEKELQRLSMMPAAAAEYTVSRTYLDWLLELPWQKTTRDNLDIDAAQKILDEDHYGLKKVKERIVEYLAVRKLKKDMKGPILCFVGPPGVGKTSLGKSIARALGRNFVRMSLGGVRDEAEIRGHRRTYVGALPGRIVQNIRRAASANPVFMLDEVDKIGMDFRGDPASALLEVLDPEQNFAFSDHYLDVDFDLSRVMFITTANIQETIPSPLLDRMEVLRLPGYIVEEKLAIAQQYLIPKQLDAHGLEKGSIHFSEKALRRVIQDYTLEAGVRNLEREIAQICRKVARAVASGKRQGARVSERDLTKYLGPQRFFSERAERLKDPGVAVGLAWTAAGGDIMYIEATRMPGKKGLVLTGSLGDVMKESAQAALSFVRANAAKLDVPVDFFENEDLHIHVPEGAIPKDGPSAGVTIFTALTSLLSRRTVKSDLAMTGEITLRGLVLPVGGIKEKVLAAHRSGIRHVILPERNKKDLEDIPPKVRKTMQFQFVQRMNEIPQLALNLPGEQVRDEEAPPEKKKPAARKKAPEKKKAPAGNAAPKKKPAAKKPIARKPAGRKPAKGT